MASQGRHRKPGTDPREDALGLQDRRVRVSEQREARFQRQQARRETSGGGVAKVARAPAKITQRSGSYSGKGMLTAELLAGFLIVLIRIVADYEVQEGGAVKGKVLHPNGQYGPLPILVGLVGTFFALSFVAASGGNKAKLAVVFGGVVVLALGVKSTAEIETVASTIGSIGSIAVPAPSGTESSAASNPNSPVNLSNAPNTPLVSGQPSSSLTNVPGTNTGPTVANPPPLTGPASPVPPGFTGVRNGIGYYNGTQIPNVGPVLS